ncbi:ABC transporter substrate-binding protein [Jiangella endophytica]|uniref:ABC transporter substrate-binding protein n=1 Tax=Jiangella endophytica TaxID=1623398 RepID=UPI000E34D8AE|nr:ABC transporter substrate-binding protein [Jiangella endophytica]
MSIRSRRFPRLLVAAAALTALVLAGCGDDASDDAGSEPADVASPRPGGTLTVALQTDPLSVDPRAYTFGAAVYVTRQVVDSLVAQDPADGSLVPWLAESWQVSPDATTFTFHLRDDVTFSDGTPLTAEVVKANFDDLTANQATVNPVIVSQLAGFEAATVTDEHTVEFTFTEHNAAFLQATSEPGLGILAPATLALPVQERTADVVGTGPFVLESYEKDAEVSLGRRDGYAWAPPFRENTGAAYLDQIVFTVVPESAVRSGSLESDQVLAIADVPAQDVAALRDGGYAIVDRPNPGVVYGLLPVSTPRQPLDDVDVRRALSHAIDGTLVRDTVLSPEFAPATGVLSTTTPGYVDLGDEIAFDPDTARELLDGAGWREGADGTRERDGQRLRLVAAFLDDFSANQPALELIAAQLADVGVELELAKQAPADLLAGLENVTTDLLWNSVTRAEGDILRSFSSAPPNYYHYDDPELDALLTEQRGIGDPGRRADLHAEIQRRIIDQALIVPVFEQTAVLATSASVHGLALGANSRLDQLGDVWLSE